MLPICYVVMYKVSFVEGGAGYFNLEMCRSACFKESLVQVHCIYPKTLGIYLKQPLELEAAEF